ncbi:MAG: ATP-binding protein [Sandaracinaceae bacterium]
MRHLWVRIFAGMMVANALAVVGVVVAYQSQMERHRERGRSRDGAAIAHYAADAAQALERGGPPAALAVLRRAQDRAGLRIALVGADGARVAGTFEPPPTMSAIRDAAEHPEGVPFEQGEPPAQAVRLAGGLVAVGVPEPPEGMLGLSPPVMQLLVVGLLSAILSLLLARWISGPLRTLRGASERLLAGPGAVRVVPAISPLADAEARALASDFDRMAERIEGLLAARERLLRDVSHELRSPLARLTVALELARESAGDEAQPFLERIGRDAQRLEELIGLVLTMAKLEQLPELARRDDVALDALVADICEDAAFEAEPSGRFVELVAHGPVVLRGDEEILRRAVENVVRNAVRWTPEGTTVEVSIDVAPSMGGEVPWATVRVRDHGPGVPEEALDDIFQPFTRVESARERSEGGAGLGLAITARALRLHGGRVRAENANGGGLRVTLELPLSIAEDAVP